MMIRRVTFKSYLILIAMIPISLHDSLETLSYKVIKNKRSQAFMQTSCKARSLVECVQQCTANRACHAVHYNNRICEILEELVSCLEIELQSGWKYVYIGKYVLHIYIWG